MTNETVMTTRGTLTFEDKVIQKIVGYAIANVTGLLNVSGGFLTNIKNKIVSNDNVSDGINVEVGQEQVAVDLKIVVDFDANAHDIYKQMQTVIAKELVKTTGLTLIELNVTVVDIQTKDEFLESQVTLQDHLENMSQKVASNDSKELEKIERVQ